MVEIHNTLKVRRDNKNCAQARLQQIGLIITFMASQLVSSLFNFLFNRGCDRGLERAFAKCGRLRCEGLGD